MDEDIRAALGDIKSTVERNSEETRRSISKLHGRVDEQGRELSIRISEHAQESAVRSARIQERASRAEADVNRIGTQCREDAGRVAQKLKDHVDWHESERKRGKGYWLAIALAIFGFFLNATLEGCKMIADKL